jgi:hypothetical protein
VGETANVAINAVINPNFLTLVIRSLHNAAIAGQQFHAAICCAMAPIVGVADLESRKSA